MIIEGSGLHGGRSSRVILSRCDGPVLLRTAAGQSLISDLRVFSTDRATAVRSLDGRVVVRTVEHLFAALAGLGIRDGVCADVEGDELPLLDGSARRWGELLRELGARPSAEPPALEVLRDGVIEIEESRYAFARGAAVSVSVEIAFGDPRVAADASWSGDPEDFFERIAPARTFAFARELESLAARGLASHVEPESVVVLAPDAIHSAGRPFSADEPARHKLLDLIGDLYLHGGPPLGSVRAYRPGHRVTHLAVCEALARGILGMFGAMQRQIP